MGATLVLLAALFLSAGTLRWPMGWAYALMTVGAIIVSRVAMARRNPDLIAERANYQQAEGVKPWDRKLMPLTALVGPLAMLVVAGLNYRFGWPPQIPLWVQIAALAVTAAASLFSSWATTVNRFFSAVVRIQTDRGHTVISDGPYKYVRHPGYAGGVVADLAGPIALGSAWALIPGLATVALIVVRTALEDRTLREELPGYQAYAQRVRYRLLPGIW